MAPVVRRPVITLSSFGANGRRILVFLYREQLAAAAVGRTAVADAAFVSFSRPARWPPCRPCPAGARGTKSALQDVFLSEFIGGPELFSRL